MAKARKTRKKGLLARAAQGVDSAFGLTSEYKRSLGLRGNPARSAAARRRLYRLGHASARKNPGDAGAALMAVERTVVFKEAAVGDLASAREFFLAGYHDGTGERGNPKAQSAFDRCVAEVAKKGGAYDPRAVCAASARRKGRRDLGKSRSRYQNDQNDRQAATPWQRGGTVAAGGELKDRKSVTKRSRPESLRDSRKWRAAVSRCGKRILSGISPGQIRASARVMLFKQATRGILSRRGVRGADGTRRIPWIQRKTPIKDFTVTPRRKQP